MRLVRFFVDCIKSEETRSCWRSILLSPILLIGFEYLAVARIGTHVFLWWSTMFYGIVGLAAILAVPVLPFVAIWRSKRHTAMAWWIASICFIFLFFIGETISLKLRTHAFHKLATRSELLVGAIKKYEIEHSKPPESLSELVPDYLPEVPSTGIMAYPTYQYHTSESASEGNHWKLWVSTPSGGINFDRFIYYPNETYPETGPSGWFEQIGNWAYYHE